MTDISKKALGKIKKVSINVNQEFIELADKIGELTNQNRTMIFGAWVNKGIEPLFKDMETTWEGVLIAGNLNTEKKKKVESLLKGIKKIKKEWSITLEKWLA